nr:immunoglobulin light chain junction region [Macaca mulatta]
DYYCDSWDSSGSRLF